MRYWVYKDAQILGPLDGEDLIHRQDLNDSLICPEGATGVQESDWRSAKEIFESQAWKSGSLAKEPSAQSGATAVSEGWGDYTRGEPPVGGEEGPLGSMYHFGPTCDIQFKTAKSQIGDLQDKLEELTKKIEQYEERQNMLLERIGEKDKLVEEKQRFIETLQTEVHQIQRRPPAPADVPSSWIADAHLASRSLLPEPPIAEAPAESVEPRLVETPPAPEPLAATVPPAITAPPPPQTPVLAPDEPIEFINEIPASVSVQDTTSSRIQSQGFTPPVPEAAIAAPKVEAPPEPVVPSVSLPFAPPTPEISTVPSAPPFVQTPSSPAFQPMIQPVEEPVKPPMVEAAPPPTQSPFFTPPPVQIPEAAPVTKTPLPSTPFEPLKPTVPTPSFGSPASPFEPKQEPMEAVISKPKPRSSPFEEVPPISLGKKSKPLPLPIAKKDQKIVPIIFGVAGVAAVGILIVYFMTGSKKEPAPTTAEPAAVSTASQPVSQQKGQVGQAQPTGTPGRDYIADMTPKAIEMVKNYPLSRGRQTVSRWLQYSFLTVPGNEDEWTAGAQAADSYIVQYRVYRGGRSVDREPISYIFEANLANKTVQGLNQAAKELLMGGEPVKQVRPVARKPVKTKRPVVKKQKKVVKKPKKVKKQPVPQLPLPGMPLIN